jgi:predicted AlkP superfamily phosphohydrolase/phosphomutase
VADVDVQAPSIGSLASLPVGSRALVIGLDAAERSIAGELVEQGRMPAVASLLDRGHRADLEAPRDVYVGAVWPTLFTGTGPGVHGRWAPQRLRPGTYETEWVGARSAVEPFWGELARAGRQVAAVDVPLAPLVEAPGVWQLAEWATHDNAGPQRRFVDRGPDPFAGLEATAVDSCDRFHREGRLDDLRDHLVGGVGRKVEVVEDLLGTEVDLVVAVFGESHCVGHQCWHVRDEHHPRHDPSQAEALGDPIADVYVALDEAVGRLVASAGEGTTVALVLSHGMGPHHDGIHLFAEVLRRIEDEVLGPPPRTAVARAKVGRGLRRVGRRSAPKRTGGAFGRSLDASRRFLRAPNAAPVGCVRFNLVGREPAGRVAPSEVGGLYDLLERELRALVDPADGEPVVLRVERVADVHQGPFAEDIGDVFVEWRRDRPITAVASPTVGEVRGTYTGIRTGDHHPGGLLVTAGPDAAPLPPVVGGAEVAPMVSGWLGVG